jgi:hypothetical protein
VTSSLGLPQANQLAAQPLGVADLLGKPLMPEDLGATIDQGLTGVQTVQRGA